MVKVSEFSTIAAYILAFHELLISQFSFQAFLGLHVRICVPQQKYLPQTTDRLVEKCLIHFQRIRPELLNKKQMI